MSDLNSDDNTTIVHQHVKVQANVGIKPNIRNGSPTVYCTGSNIRPANRCRLRLQEDDQIADECYVKSRTCNFILTQILCVEIPIEIDVDIDIDEGIVQCGRPAIGPCIARCNKPYDKDDYTTNEK